MAKLIRKGLIVDTVLEDVGDYCNVMSAQQWREGGTAVLWRHRAGNMAQISSLSLSVEQQCERRARPATAWPHHRLPRP